MQIVPLVERGMHHCWEGHTPSSSGYSPQSTTPALMQHALCSTQTANEAEAKAPLQAPRPLGPPLALLAFWLLLLLSLLLDGNI